MFKNILVPTDGSELSERAVHAAVQFARAIGAKVTGVYATEEYPVSPFAEFLPADTPTPEEFQAMQNARAAGYLQKIEEEAASSGVPCQSSSLPRTLPYKAIIEAAEKNGCDLIFMACHGRSGLSALLLGSETNKVLTHTRIPVLVYR